MSTVFRLLFAGLRGSDNCQAVKLLLHFVKFCSLGILFFGPRAKSPPMHRRLESEKLPLLHLINHSYGTLLHHRLDYAGLCDWWYPFALDFLNIAEYGE